MTNMNTVSTTDTLALVDVLLADASYELTERAKYDFAFELYCALKDTGETMDNLTLEGEPFFNIRNEWVLTFVANVNGKYMSNHVFYGMDNGSTFGTWEDVQEKYAA